MSRFREKFEMEVRKDIHEILVNDNLSNREIRLEIKDKLRQLYFVNQKEIKKVQVENCEFSIFDYYKVQESLVRKFQEFSSFDLIDWRKLILKKYENHI